MSYTRRKPPRMPLVPKMRSAREVARARARAQGMKNADKVRQDINRRLRKAKGRI